MFRPGDDDDDDDDDDDEVMNEVMNGIRKLFITSKPTKRIPKQRTDRNADSEGAGGGPREAPQRMFSDARSL